MEWFDLFTAAIVIVCGAILSALIIKLTLWTSNSTEKYYRLLAILTGPLIYICIKQIDLIQPSEILPSSDNLQKVTILTACLVVGLVFGQLHAYAARTDSVATHRLLILSLSFILFTYIDVYTVANKLSRNGIELRQMSLPNIFFSTGFFLHLVFHARPDANSR